jgi:hypothetical protein
MPFALRLVQQILALFWLKRKKNQQQFTRCFLSHWGFFHSLLEQIFALGVDMVWQKPMVTLTDVMAGEYHTGISRIA